MLPRSQYLTSIEGSAKAETQSPLRALYSVISYPNLSKTQTVPHLTMLIPPSLRLSSLRPTNVTPTEVRVSDCQARAEPHHPNSPPLQTKRNAKERHSRPPARERFIPALFCLDLDKLPRPARSSLGGRDKQVWHWHEWSALLSPEDKCELEGIWIWDGREWAGMRSLSALPSWRTGEGGRPSRTWGKVGVRARGGWDTSRDLGEYR